MGNGRRVRESTAAPRPSAEGTAGGRERVATPMLSGVPPRAAVLPVEKECWYCKFADFHLKERIPLDVGICCWPNKQMD